MKSSRVLLLLVLIPALAACDSPSKESARPALGTAQTDTTATLQEFDAYLEKTAGQLGDSPFAAVVSKNGEILYERYL